MKIGSTEISRQDLRDAIRLGLQGGVAAAATFGAMHALDLGERFVGIISAVLVVQPSVGGTLGAAKQRLAATVIGSLVGLVCLQLLPGGYGTLVALAVSIMTVNTIAGIWPEWSYGAVAAVAIALGSEENVFATAQARAIAIGLGSLLGLVTALVVWPDSASKRAEKHLERALGAIAKRLQAVLAATKSGRTGTGKDARDGYHSAISDARDAADAIRLRGNETIMDKIRHAERLYNSVLILKRLAGKDADLGDSEELARRIESTADLGGRIVDQLTSRSEDARSRLEELQDELQKARSAGAFDEQGEKATERHVLLFGLDQVEDGFRNLMNAYGDKHGNTEPG